MDIQMTDADQREADRETGRELLATRRMVAVLTRTVLELEREVVRLRALVPQPSDANAPSEPVTLARRGKR
jgi:hypothetical protein